MARRIIMKQDGLANQPTAPSGYKYIGFDGDTFSEKTSDTVSGIGGSTAMVYTATITQSDGSDPVATEGVNTTGTTITFARTAQGTYTITAGSAIFLANKWSVTFNNAVISSDIGQNILDKAESTFARTSDTVLTYNTFWLNAGIPVQDSITSGQIKIEVWS